MPPSPFFGKAFCEAATALQPCAPSNRVRIVKLGATGSVKALEHRAAPLAILQKLLLVEQALPLSNFYFKIQLHAGVTDSIFLTQIRKFNDTLGQKLFHSFYDGVDTHLFHPYVAPFTHVLFRAPRVDTSSRPRSRVAVVLESPPFKLKLAHVRAWAEDLKLEEFCARWAVSSSGSSCAVVEFQPSLVSSPPSSFVFEGHTYKLQTFSPLPSSFRALTGERSASQALKAAESSPLPRRDQWPPSLMTTPQRSV